MSVAILIELDDAPVLNRLRLVIGRVVAILIELDDAPVLGLTESPTPSMTSRNPY